jgi:phosphoglycerate dehydrogenase-like enzyme
MKARVLVAAPFEKEEFDGLTPYAEMYWLDGLDEKELESVLPTVDCLFVHMWPKVLDDGRLSKMERLTFIQSSLAGVNQIPFERLGSGVKVSSNAGGYSLEVGEYAWGLLMTAAKKVAKFDRTIREKGPEVGTSRERGAEVMVLNGRTLGLLGYGGIGKTVARFGMAFGMRVIAYSRSPVEEPGVAFYHGTDGLKKMLPECDALVIALPLTNSTRNLVGPEELSAMKEDAVVVNVARSEIVNKEAIYGHLSRIRSFTYATDVWWMRDGRESYAPDLPFLSLDNFIGTPHVAGPSALSGMGPIRQAVENLARFLKGERPANVVDRREYL